ncbi:HlyD family efflux transporter periplasmic adaptor subunit [Variovorax sp. EBFNA2]|uniref:HlyD family efflux transporter periplasmic adaptor subunit n=1 Tax=Variovorax sp. EBFNA2 TaxID=3342097 RepID=UPI0029C051B2|nr:HlyD family efflux transporter periplasmic adaptor subunit [Variovorax boronicumulans]WPG39562.1 HlyD family efflux transporter periplasmic adaptor subunit [Variovorax boronicumulans]
MPVSRPIPSASKPHAAVRARPRAVRGRRRRQRGALVPRLAGYALLAFVLWLMVATLVEPLLSSQATRAVLQAPVGIVTSPINGVVTQMAVRSGNAVLPGTLVATVRNPTVSQEILTTLTTQRLGLQSQMAQLGNQYKSDSQEMRSIGQQAQVTRQASLAQTWDAWEIAQRQRDVAHSMVAEQENKVRTNEALLKEGAISEQVMNASEAQLSTARAAAAVAEQAFAGQAQTVASAGQGAFVGTGGNSLFQTLASRREALRNSTDRARQDGTAIFKQLKEISQLEEEERRRVEKLAAYEVKATQPGMVHTVLTPEGAYVTAGASLVRVTDCSRIGVIAVFPARLAKRLSVGSMLDVKVAENVAVPARVEQLLPVASDALQSTYSVPFPFAEQGSIYAVARIEAAEPPQSADGSRQTLCVPGKVVSASLAKA